MVDDDDDDDDRKYSLFAKSRSELSPSWTSRNEVVRDLHRAAENQQREKRIPMSRSQEGSRLARNYQLHPEVGTASDLAQPGGFRRAHCVAASASDEEIVSSTESASLTRRAPKKTRRVLLTPLLDVLEYEGFINKFITRAVQPLGDGTEVVYESRAYRRGARPRILSSKSGEELNPQVRLRFFGFRPRSVPYWSSTAFLFGAILFTWGSFYWMAVGRGIAPAWAVSYPYFIGGFGFWSGCYLAFVEVINANLSEELAAGKLDRGGSIHRQAAAAPNTPTAARTPSAGNATRGAQAVRPGPLFPAPTSDDAARGYAPPRASALDAAAAHAPSSTDNGGAAGEAPERRFSVDSIGVESESSINNLDAPAVEESFVAFLAKLHWWRYQPKSLLWWGALVQFVGSTLFQVCLTADLPAVGLAAYGWWAQAAWVYAPSVLGSVCFTFASYVYLLEVAVDTDAPWRPPPRLREQLGFGCAWCNLVGSVLYTLASACYFAHAAHDELEWDGLPYEWEYLASEWGVRFGFGVGSLCFVAGTILGFPDVFSDDDD